MSDLQDITMASLTKFTIEDYKKISEFGKTRNVNGIITLLHTKMNVIEKTTNHYNIDTIKKFNETYSKDVIPYDTYNTHYVFSDIHADLMSFFSTLLKSDLLILKDTAGNTIDPILIIKELQTEYTSINILDRYLCNFNLELNCGPNTLILILGDLIDGQRGGKHVHNPTGLNELLIHMILYNMRLDAVMSKNSYVKVVIGNHDIDAIGINKFTDEPKNNPHTKLLFFMDENTFKFYKNPEINNLMSQIYNAVYDRKMVLCLFYLIDASIYELIIKDKIICTVLSHGSFSSGNFENTRLIPNLNLFTNTTNLNLIIKKIEIKHFLWNSFEEYKGFTKNIEINNQIYNDIVNEYDFKYSSRVQDEQQKESAKHFINKKMDFKELSPESLILYNTWSRALVRLSCDELHNYISEYTTFIMGHCITNEDNIGKYHDIGYETCKTLKNKDSMLFKECVYISCIFNKIPKLILVDNAWANPNSRNQDTLPMYTELLIMKKNNTESFFDYYTLRTPLKVAETPNTIYKTDVQENTMYPKREPITVEQNIILKGGKIRKYLNKLVNEPINSDKFKLYLDKLNYYYK